MRINSINSTINYSRNCKRSSQKLHANEPNPEVSFKGLKGRVDGGVIGLIASLLLVSSTDPLFLAALPSLTTLGAYLGDVLENKSKDNKNSKN